MKHKRNQSANQLTVKRLCIYLAFSFLLVWIPTIVYRAKGGAYESGAMQTILTYSMLCPSVAMVLTRWLTGEGFPMRGENSLKLGIGLKDKKWIWYVVAVLVPILYRELGMALIYLVAPESYDPAMLAEYGITENTAWLFPLSAVTSACIYSVGALGEEAGWRGYMMPKLEELLGTGKAILVGGILWGLWHFPAIVAGHNFGTGYWGEPWTGFFVFTLFTICIGAVLTYLTKKTDSVWPAAFLHAVNNSMGSVLYVYYNEDKLSGIRAEAPVTVFIQQIPAMLFGVAIMILLSKKGVRKNMLKKEKSA